MAFCQTAVPGRMHWLVLPILRAVVLASVAAVRPDDEISTAIVLAGGQALLRSTAIGADAVAYVERDGEDVTVPFPASACAFSAHAAATAGIAHTAVEAAGNVFRAIDEATLPNEGDVIGVLSDLMAVEEGRSLELLPIWHDENPLLEYWQTVRANWSQPNSPYAFWLRWYESLLDPASHPPFPPELLREIALIPSEVWEAGAEAVAAAIARIEERFRLLEETRALKAELAALRAATEAEALRRHNNPPELVEEDEALRGEVTIIWAALDESEAELTQPAPSPSVLRKAAATVAAASKALLKWFSKTADRVVDTALTAGMTYLISTGQLVPLVERLLEYSKDVVTFIGHLL